MSSSAWRTIDFTSAAGELHYERGQVVFVRAETDERQTVPLAQVAVILIGAKTSISGGLLTKLSDEDVAVVVCDWRNVPVAAALPWRDHTRIGARQKAQSELTEPRRKNAWSRIVKAKIHGQANTAAALGNEQLGKQLEQLAAKVVSGDPHNVEALAARQYWEGVTSDPRFARHPGAREEGLNSALDYAYTILRGQGIKALSGAGLTGTIGVFHRNRGNPFALVDDLIEPFRPAVDYYLLASDSDFDLNKKEVKGAIFLAANQVFDATGHTIPTVQEDFAQQFGKYVEGDSRFLDVPTWRGPFDAEDGE